MNSKRTDPKYECAVCGCKSIAVKGVNEICGVCDWIDGDNGDYTVEEARNNFDRSGTVYRTEDPRFPENGEFLLTNWKLRKAYHVFDQNPSEEAEKALDDLKEKRMITPRMGGAPLWAPTGEPIHECPCCHYPTLSERGSFEICDVCHWEDEFVDYPPEDEVIGGANGDYSMKEARENLARYGLMYRPGDYRAVASEEERQIQWNIMKAYAEIKRSGPSEELFEQVDAHLKKLRKFWDEKMDKVMKDRK